MAVQSHYHLHKHHLDSPFLTRGGDAPESSRAHAPAMELTRAQKGAKHPPLFLDFAHEDCGGGRKGQHEAEAVSMSPQLFLLQPQAQGPKVTGLQQRRKRPAMDLRLDFDEGLEFVSSTSVASASCLFDEVAAQRDQCKNEMERLIQEHAERLRRAIADMRRRQYRSLLRTAEAMSLRRIREKEAEASEAGRRGAEMEERIARLTAEAEASAWQAKALADQSTAAALHAQLQQATAAAQARCKAEEDDAAAAGAAADAESCFADPDRVVEVPAPPPLAMPCRTCGRRSASVVLLPCRHLCLCAACEHAGTASAAACPMCCSAITGAVQVFFS